MTWSELESEAYTLAFGCGICKQLRPTLDVMKAWRFRGSQGHDPCPNQKSSVIDFDASVASIAPSKFEKGE